MNRHLTKEDVETANKHMKRCLKSLIIREMQVKRTTKYSYIPIRMAKIPELIIPVAGKDVKQWEF